MNSTIFKIVIYNLYELKNALKSSENLLNRIEISTEHKFDLYKNKLKKRISDMFTTSEFIQRSMIENEIYEQDGIKYLLQRILVNQFSKKEISINKKEFFDPFGPPFMEGAVIEDDFNNYGHHRLFFNKYPICDEHIILVTREFISQYTHLTIEEIKNGLLLMNMMNGIIFFNGGMKSGASQPRKHLQCIPMDSFYNKDFGLFSLISDVKNLTFCKDSDFNESNFYKFYTIYQFTNANIPHILIKFSSYISELLNNTSYESIEIISNFIFNLYNVALLKINLIVEQEIEKISKDYSFLMTNEWMLIIPRKTHVVKLEHGHINMNSIGYTLSILIKTDELKEQIKNLNILEDIYSKL